MTYAPFIASLIAALAFVGGAYLVMRKNREEAAAGDTRIQNLLEEEADLRQKLNALREAKAKPHTPKYAPATGTLERHEVRAAPTFNPARAAHGG